MSEINQKHTVSFFVSLCVILSTTPSVLPMLGNHITNVLFPQPSPFRILRQGLTKFFQSCLELESGLQFSWP